MLFQEFRNFPHDCLFLSLRFLIVCHLVPLCKMFSNVIGLYCIVKEKQFHISDFGLYEGSSVARHKGSFPSSSGCDQKGEYYLLGVILFVSPHSTVVAFHPVS